MKTENSTQQQTPVILRELQLCDNRYIRVFSRDIFKFIMRYRINIRSRIDNYTLLRDHLVNLEAVSQVYINGTEIAKWCVMNRELLRLWL